MFGLMKKEMLENDVSTKVRVVDDADEFQIPTLVLCKTPNAEEMERRRKITSLRRQYGIRFEDVI